MTDGDDEDARRVNWLCVALWTCFGVVLLGLAGALKRLWGWTGVSIDVLVHVGGTLLLAPLLPFLERGLTRRVVQENKRMVQEQTAGLREQVDSLATRIDQLQRLVDQQDAENVEDQDRIIDALSEEASFTNVASAMAVANVVGASAGSTRAIVLSVAYKRRDTTVPWRLHGGLYELHGEDWAITEAGIEYRPASQIVLAEADFPDPAGRSGMTSASDLGEWAPAPSAGADPVEWQYVLWRGMFHFPVYRGPARAQPVRFACRTLPKTPAAKQ